MVSQEDLLDSTSAYGEGQRKNTKRLEPTLEMSLTKQKTKARTTTAICDGAVKWGETIISVQTRYLALADTIIRTTLAHITTTLTGITRNNTINKHSFKDTEAEVEALRFRDAKALVNGITVIKTTSIAVSPLTWQGTAIQVTQANSTIKYLTKRKANKF